MREVLDLGAVGIAALNSISNHGTTFPRFSWVAPFEPGDGAVFSSGGAIGPGTTGTWDMALWRILVMGVLKQGLNVFRSWPTSIGRYANGARTRSTNCKRSWQCPSVDPGAAVGGRGSRGGEWASGGGTGEPLRGRCDSFVVETNVHYPTDVGLLWDAMRTGPAAQEHGVVGWRQWRHLSREVRTLFMRSTRASRTGGVCQAMPGLG